MKQDKTIYFSGVDRVSRAELVKSEGGEIMFSPPARLVMPSLRGFLMSSAPPVGVLDSGAYQGFSDVDRYADILLETHEYLRWFVNLDVIGNQSLSNKNFERLHHLLPSDVAKKIIWVFQPGGDYSMISDYGAGSLVGIGGLVRMSRSPGRLRGYLEGIGEHLLSVNATAHLFGMTNLQLLLWAAFQDWFTSADSTRWIYGLKSGEIITLRGDCFDSISRGMLFTPEERVRHNIRVLRQIVQGAGKKMQLSLLSFLDDGDCT